ncbi:MAG: serine hydrolase [Candidatus Falkowbacteria bacterium]|nr:serine hydrolase [Candidatus Falkowbacteria bacterium]
MFKGFFLIIVLVCSFLFAPNLVLAQTSNAYEKLGMSSVCLNAKTGKIISGENQNQVLPLASLTKLMTAQVLLDLKLNFQKLITISDGQMNYVNAYIDKGDITSKINMQTGDKVMAKDLWHAMLIASSNESAIALVDSSGIGRAKFVEKMNKKAKVFGLRNTKFTEPSGIDPNNLGTASDMAIIANKVLKLLIVLKI